MRWNLSRKKLTGFPPPLSCWDHYQSIKSIKFLST